MDYYTNPLIAMLLLQFSYAGVNLFAKLALLEGMSPMVFVTYRQAVATLVMFPIACFTRKRTSRGQLGLWSFFLIFLASFIGVTVNQTTYYAALYFASASIGSAMFNLVPAVTFIIASCIGLENINVRSWRSMAKIIGTIICVGGAVAMALLRGPKLLNMNHLPFKSLFGSDGHNWLLGCLLAFASSCSWAIWLILQVPLTSSYPDHLSLSAWMCFMATVQSSIVTLFLEPELQAWKLNSYMQLIACVYSGVIGSGVSFIVQSWCISLRGPVFSAMFNPLCTVIVTVLATIFLHEQMYAGSLAGAIAVIIGLYFVLWGKAKDIEDSDQLEADSKLQTQCTSDDVQVTIDRPLDKKVVLHGSDLQEALLGNETETNS